MLISTISYASFPVTNDGNIIESTTTSTIINDSFNTLGWIVLSCLTLGGILVALQFIIDPYAYIAGYFIVGYIVAGVGVLLGLVWLFSRFKWGRKYWWIILLSLFLIQIILEQDGLA
tara:strand:- start:857 stop:1207 length:351 start_codon:yes stop_codon:yes gene_type:complete